MTTEFKVPSIDYTSRDYESIRDDMIRWATALTTEWTDFNPDDLGVVLLQLGAGTADVLHYYIDRGAAEGSLETCITEEAARDHNALIDYTPPSAGAAVVDLDFTVQAAAASSASYAIPALTTVTTIDDAGDPVVFETDEDLVIAVGATTGTVSATEGTTQGQVAPDGEEIGVSDGTAFQSFRLLTKGVLNDTVRLFVNESGSTWEEYTKVSSFVLEQPDSKVFRLLVDDAGYSRVVTGDNVNGLIPPAAATLQVAYRIGGGARGNVGADTLKTITSSLSGGFTVAVTNSEPATGGTDAPSIAELKELGPRSLKTFGRAVNLDDYESLALENQNVAAASAVYDDDEQKVLLYIAASDGLTTTKVKNQVDEDISAVDLLGFDLEARDATLVPINILGTVNVKSNISRVATQALVDAAFDDYFTIAADEGHVNFSRDVHESDVFALLDNITGVDYVDITKLTRTPTVLFENWNAVTATIETTVDADNAIEQDITVTLDPQITVGTSVPYTVKGSVTGTEEIMGLAVFDGAADPVPFTLAGAPVTITITFPSVADIQALLAPRPVEGDVLTIKVGRYKGNQTIDDLEIAQAGTIALSIVGGVL